eukprot:gnl/TRDRNA2_/TRDRNA2_167080_c0_seq1.p1 gnl/TRDRNA2_/TRDRNA2_167080_c0~~gnl/TRDRNA2_/TRDRNA2_167080_c0_seq1.p1  ORF type:complete len:265 (-),score=44.63 gnl/TRDRNA2_/TRDRNA2_167080_c0_seq1:111-905(-)
MSSRSQSERSSVRSGLKLSTISTDDSLPLGCEHQEYYWIKRYRALKRRVEGNTGSAVGSVLEEGEEEDAEGLGEEAYRSTDAIEDALQRAQALAPPVGKMPCSRLFVKEDSPLVEPLKEWLGLGGSPEPVRLAMVKTQQSLVISPVSSRWFMMDTARDMCLLVGVTTESSDKLQPEDASKFLMVQVQVKRGDRTKLLATPALGFAPEGDIPIQNSQDFQLRGDLTVVVNNQSAASVEHDFPADEPLHGVVVWNGLLSDLRVIET